MSEEVWYLLMKQEDQNNHHVHFHGRTTVREEAENFLKEEKARFDQNSSYVTEIGVDYITHHDNLLLTGNWEHQQTLDI